MCRGRRGSSAPASRFATRQNVPPRGVLTAPAAAGTIRATGGIGWAAGPLDGWWRNRAAAAGDRCGTFCGILHAPLKVGRIRRAPVAPRFTAGAASIGWRTWRLSVRGRGGQGEHITPGTDETTSRSHPESLDSTHGLDYFHVRARRAPPVRGKGPSPTLLFDLRSNTASFGPCADIGRLRKERVCPPVLYLRVQASPNSRSRRTSSVRSIVTAGLRPPRVLRRIIRASNSGASRPRPFLPRR